MMKIKNEITKWDNKTSTIGISKKWLNKQLYIYIIYPGIDFTIWLLRESLFEWTYLLSESIDIDIHGLCLLV